MAKEVDFSLGRKDILRGFNSFQNVFEKQTSLGSDNFVIYFHKQAEVNTDIKSPSGSKAGFIVSGKKGAEQDGVRHGESSTSERDELHSQAGAWERGDIGIKAGFIVSKKKVRKSVNRNKLKRYLRELYRMNKPEVKENENLSDNLSLIISFSDAAIAEFSKSKKLDIQKMNSEFRNLIIKVLS